MKPPVLGVAVIGLTGVSHVVGSQGEVGVALLDLSLINDTKATTGFLVPDAGSTQGTSEEIEDFGAALGVSAGLVAHHLGVPDQRTGLDGEAVTEGELVVETIDLNDVAARSSGIKLVQADAIAIPNTCLLYTSPSPRDATLSRMPSSA